jgi:hypothetical protein
MARGCYIGPLQMSSKQKPTSTWLGHCLPPASRILGATGRCALLGGGNSRAREMTQLSDTHPIPVSFHDHSTGPTELRQRTMTVRH